MNVKTDTPTKILILDNRWFISERLAALLAGPDRDVIVAASVQEALAVPCRRRPIDIVLAESNLPDGTGLEAITELKRRNPKLQAFLMTKSYSVETAIETIEAGLCDYFAKPIAHLASVVSAVAQAVRRLAGLGEEEKAVRLVRDPLRGSRNRQSLKIRPSRIQPQRPRFSEAAWARGRSCHIGGTKAPVSL